MKLIISNPKAYHDFFINTEYVAGIVLKGHEVKSIKLGKANIKGSYIKAFDNELFIIGMNISKYMGEGEEMRDKKLLLNKKEIKNIIKETEAKGNTVVPLNVSLSKGFVKLKIGIAKGKKNYDKRETLIKKAQQRDAERDLKNIKYKI